MQQQQHEQYFCVRIVLSNSSYSLVSALRALTMLTKGLFRWHMQAEEESLRNRETYRMERCPGSYLASFRFRLQLCPLSAKGRVAEEGRGLGIQSNALHLNMIIINPGNGVWHLTGSTAPRQAQAQPLEWPRRWQPTTWELESESYASLRTSFLPTSVASDRLHHHIVAQSLFTWVARLT